MSDYSSEAEDNKITQNKNLQDSGGSASADEKMASQEKNSSKKNVSDQDSIDDDGESAGATKDSKKKKKGSTTEKEEGSSSSRKAKGGKTYTEDQSSDRSASSQNLIKKAKDDKKGKDKKDKKKDKNRDSSSQSLRGDKKDKDKSKKKKDKDKKHKASKSKAKDKKKKDKKSKSTHKKGASKVKKSNSSSEDDSDEKESDHWSAGDAEVDYGAAEMLSDDSDIWPDNLSNELYDSDNPDCPLNAYHIESRPRLLILEDYDNQGQPVQLQLDCIEILDKESQARLKKKKQKLKLDDKKDPVYDETVDHKSYQGYQSFNGNSGEAKLIYLHNMITQDFIRGVQKSLTCPICQEMVNNPVQYKQCIHRFCSNCIETYNRQGKKECPLCRVTIANRRQLRPDKNIASLLSHLTEEFRKLIRQEDLENAEIKRKMILEQKRLKEKKDKQKKQLTGNEMKQKHQAETKEERLARLAKEKAANPQPKKTRGAANFGGEGVVDTNHVIRLTEEKKHNLPNLLLNVDIEIILKHDVDQSNLINGVFIKRLRFMTNRNAYLIHMAVLISHKNGLREEEWSNFEFYPCLKDNSFNEDRIRKQYISGQLRPFQFRMTIYDVLKQLYPGEQSEIPRMVFIYKKKPMPQVTTRDNIVKGLTAQCIIPPVIKDEAIRKHAMPYTPGYNPTNTLQGMLQAKQEQQQQMQQQSNQFKNAQNGQSNDPPKASFPQANVFKSDQSSSQFNTSGAQAPQATVHNQNNTYGVGGQEDPSPNSGMNKAPPSATTFQGQSPLQTNGNPQSFQGIKDQEVSTSFQFANPTNN